MKDFCELFLVENLVLGDKAGTDSKVLLGSHVVFLKVVAVVETCPAEVPVPGDKVDAEFGLVSSQHSPVEVGQHSKVSSQPLCPQGGSLLQQGSVFPHHTGQICGSLTGLFPFQICHILLPVAYTAALCDPAERVSIPLHGK